MGTPPLARVKPRMPMEALVDKDAHPSRTKIRTVTDEDAPEGYHWTVKAAIVALAVFWVTLPAAGLLGPLLGLWAGLGLAGLAVSSLVVAWLLGGE